MKQAKHMQLHARTSRINWRSTSWVSRRVRDMLSSTQSKLRYSIELLANMASCDISSHYSFFVLIRQTIQKRNNWSQALSHWANINHYLTRTAHLHTCHFALSACNVKSLNFGITTQYNLTYGCLHCEVIEEVEGRSIICVLGRRKIINNYDILNNYDKRSRILLLDACTVTGVRGV